MNVLISLLNFLFEKELFFDTIGDLRTISAATIVLGGVSRFFGIYNQHYVTIAAEGTWIVCIILMHFRGKKI